MNFNKPPFDDPLVDIDTPPIGETEDLSARIFAAVNTNSMNDMWKNYHALLNDQLSTNLSDFGYIYPAVSSSTLTTNISKFGQSMVYNNDLNRLEINNGNRTNPANRAPTSEPIQTYGALTTTEIATEAVKPENLGRIFVNSATNELQFSIDGTTIRTITSV